MGREIKFRAWNTSRNHFVDPDATNDGVGITFDGKVSFCRESYFGFVGEGGFIVEQFTGLKDKNGVEIYEGDLVEYTQPVTISMGYPSGEGEEAEVIFLHHKSTSGWFIKHPSYCWYLSKDFAEESLKVAGNIHEGILPF